MKLFSQIALILILALGLVGCNTIEKMCAPNDEVLTYKLPYDLTYLRTMEALDSKEYWQLEDTDKEKGIIVVRNTNYSRLDDSDLRVITFIVKRLDNHTTSVSIDPDSQKVCGGAALLKAVSATLARESQS